MPGFDITSILDFQPPRYICPNCRGLFKTIQHYKKELQGKNILQPYCPICKSEFVKDPNNPWSADTYPHKFLKESGNTVEYGQELFAHARILATLIRESKGERSWTEPWPTMRLFFEVLSRARHFVHFASWGISHLMIGALKVTSMRVPVYGFVSNVEEHARIELAEFPDEAPRLHAHVIQPTQGAWDAPHQKLIIVDGLLAFKGSTNLTNRAIRKADRGLDLNESITDFEQVTDLNNRYFAPVWKSIVNPAKNEIVMDEPPF
jgi:hypothetical protein